MKKSERRTPAIEIEDPREYLVKQMERDPEGHFHATIAGDRRLPPWFGAEHGSAAPDDVADRVRRFIVERCVGQRPEEFEIRHNWFDRQMELIRWLPDFTPQDKAGKIALVTFTPLTLYQWADRQGWLPHGEGTLDFFWTCFAAHGEDAVKKAKYQAVKEAWVTVNRLCSIVSQGVATGEQLDEYEAALRIADPDGWAETYELAKDMRRPMGALMDELGV
jgi:hypothetical protein